MSRRKRCAFVALTLLLSTVVMLAIGEFAARWYLQGSFFEAVDSVFGLRTAEEPGSTPSLVPDPVLGFRLNPELDDVNSLGFRGPDPGPKRSDVFRIVVLGDSVTFPKDGWARHMHDRLTASLGKRIETFNAACHGYTTFQERMYLERDLLVLTPDLVVLQYCVNDNYRFLHVLTSKGRRLMTLEARSFLFPEDSGILAWLSRKSYLVYGIRRALLGLEAPGGADAPWEHYMFRAAWTDETWNDQELHIRAIHEKLTGIGARFAVLAVPHEIQIDPVLLARDAAMALKPQRKLRDICARIDLPFVDVQPGFVAAAGSDLYTDGLHLTDAGHELTGRIVAEFLVREGLVPAR